jgi:hypothetical protein
MAAAEGSRKLLCACGKPLAVFDAKGLNLFASPRRRRRCHTELPGSRKRWPSWTSGGGRRARQSAGRVSKRVDIDEDGCDSQ